VLKRPFGSFKFDQYTGGDLTEVEEGYLAAATLSETSRVLGTSMSGLIEPDCHMITYGSIIVSVFYAGGIDDGAAQAVIAAAVSAGEFVAAGVKPSIFTLPPVDTTTVGAAIIDGKGDTTNTNVEKNANPVTDVPASNFTDLLTNDARASTMFPGMSIKDAGLALAGMVLAVLFVGGFGFSYFVHPNKTVEAGDETNGMALSRSTVINSFSAGTPGDNGNRTSPVQVSQRPTTAMSGMSGMYSNYDVVNQQRQAGVGTVLVC
jgi:hypothetical protein